MHRPSWNEYFFNITKVVAERSSCLRRQIAAIAVKDKRILATGYNGAPSGIKHCADRGGCLRERLGIPSGEQQQKCLHGDTVIKLLNGKYETIKNLAKDGKDVWVYACDSSGKIIPVLAKNPRKTGERNDLVEIILDTGNKLKCTKDHKILLRNGEYKEAQYLIPEVDSLMPMYYNLRQNGSNKYEYISNTIRLKKEGKHTTWRNEYSGRTRATPTHHLVYKFVNNDSFNEDELIHHENENSLNNEPKNLIKMTRSDHTSKHIDEKYDKQHYQKMQKCSIESQKNNPKTMKHKSEIGFQNMTKLWSNKDFRKKQVAMQSVNGKRTAQKTNSDPKSIIKRQQGRILSGLSLLLKKYKGIITTKNYDFLREKYKTPGRGAISIPTKYSIQKYFDSLSVALKLAKTYNHKIVSIKEISGTHDVYCMTIPEYHNFAVDVGNDSCVFVHNCLAIHAEENLIVQAAIHGINLSGCDIYCTNQPCVMCARKIISLKPKNLYYLNPYPDEEATELLSEVAFVHEMVSSDFLTIFTNWEFK